MPYFSDHFESSEQDWEPVNWKKDPEKKEDAAEKKEPVPFYRALINARQRAHITRHKLAQSLGIKVKQLELYENGKGEAEDECPPYFDGGIIPKEGEEEKDTNNATNANENVKKEASEQE